MGNAPDSSDLVSITQENGAITHVQIYVSETDGAVVIEIDTDLNHEEETDVRIFMNDSLDPVWEGRA
jgi:hypothetical protein